MIIYSIANYVNQKLCRKFCDDDLYPRHGCDSDAVCEKCKLGITAPDLCCGCANESMYAGNGINFVPIDKEARRWFRSIGYKKCWAWRRKYWYWKFR